MFSCLCRLSVIIVPTRSLCFSRSVRIVLTRRWPREGKQTLAEDHEDDFIEIEKEEVHRALSTVSSAFVTGSIPIVRSIFVLPPLN